MPTAAGPNTKGEENLVFGYDLGDRINSYRGRPTVNQFPIVGTVGEGPEADNTALFPTRGTNLMKRLGYGQTFGGYTIKPSDAVYKFDAVTSYVCAYHGGVATIPVGAYVTFTFEYLVSSDVTIETGFLSNIENYGNGAFSTSAPSIGNSIERNVWHKVKYTAGPKTSTAGSQAMFLYPGGCTSTRFSSTPGYILYKNPMVEFNTDTVESQYVEGTRSATQGLLDLTGNSTIDLSNVSFDSNAQVDFDGSNDYASLGNPTVLRDLTSGTIETVYYRDASTGTYQMIFTDAGSDLEITYSGNVLQFYIGNSGLNYTHAVTGQWFHVAGTWDASSKKIYLNGVEVASGTNTGIDTGNRDRYVGGRGTSFPFNGKIPMVKVYTRTLTASEVKSNFNAIKGRFNI